MEAAVHPCCRLTSRQCSTLYSSTLSTHVLSLYINPLCMLNKPLMYQLLSLLQAHSGDPESGCTSSSVHLRIHTHLGYTQRQPLSLLPTICVFRQLQCAVQALLLFSCRIFSSTRFPFEICKSTINFCWTQTWLTQRSTQSPFSLFVYVHSRLAQTACLCVFCHSFSTALSLFFVHSGFSISHSFLGTFSRCCLGCPLFQTFFKHGSH